MSTVKCALFESCWTADMCTCDINENGSCGITGLMSYVWHVNMKICAVPQCFNGAYVQNRWVLKLWAIKTLWNSAYFHVNMSNITHQSCYSTRSILIYITCTHIRHSTTLEQRTFHCRHVKILYHPFSSTKSINI